MEEKEPKKIIGLMSGTSCDSIDAGLCEVYPDMSVSLLKGINFPYPEHIREKIFSAFRGEISIKEVLTRLNKDKLIALSKQLEKELFPKENFKIMYY